jgi:hypothetical protein
MAQAEVYQMIRRRAGAAGIATKISCHSVAESGLWSDDGVSGQYPLGRNTR